MPCVVMLWHGGITLSGTYPLELICKYDKAFGASDAMLRDEVRKIVLLRWMHALRYPLNLPKILHLNVASQPTSNF